MPVIRSLTERIRAIRPLHLQFLFVVLAFIGMAVSSSLYVNSMLQAHLRRDAMDLLSQTRLKIETELLEPSTALSMASRTIHRMILQGDSAQNVLEYMQAVIAELRHKKGGFTFDSLYGYFPVFGDAYLHAPGWDPPDGYEPAERPWYTTAVEAGGDIALTPVYLNVRTRTQMISYVRHLTDEQGNTLGVVCLNMPLDRIVAYVAGMRLTEGSYGIFHNKKMDIFYHPNPDLVGKNLYDPNGMLARYTDELLVAGAISEHEIRNYLGIPSVIFTTRLANGWCLHTVTPKAEYYRELYEMGAMLGMLGVFLALVLGSILLRVDLAKKKADEESRHKSILLATLAKEREEDARTQLMLDAMPLSCMLWDANFELQACNQETAYLFNLPGKQDFRFDLHSPERQPCGNASSDMARSYLKTAFEEGYLRVEWTHRKSTGELFPTEVILVRVKHREEYIVAAYVRDLSEWKAMLGSMYKVEEELRLARDTAEAASRFKSAFLANMSHEIRTPMNAILGITEIQLQDETLDADRREAFHRIYSSSDLLLGIINDILDMSKIESGKLELLPATYDVASVINDAVQLNILRIGSKPIEFVLEVDENTPSAVVGDALRVKQILNNVLSNAFKYTAQGEVKLSVSYETASDGEGAQCAPPAGDAGAGAHEADVTLVFRVDDTGQGMTVEQISRMFEKYIRFNRSANRMTEGTGLGMSITRDLVHMMHGEIAVESEPGRGSTFTVRLPQGNTGSGVLGRELAEKLRQFHIDSTGHMKRVQIVRDPMPYGSVLVVDDVETNLYVAKGLLAPYGLEVDFAVSGFAALEKIDQGRVYDIVFMDHMMPAMDGMEATCAIRARGYSCPIVALTANAVLGQAEIFRANGFDEFISKPIDIRELNAVLNRFVRDRHPPEVVDAARREKQADAHDAEDTPQASAHPQLVNIFLRDALSAVLALEAFHARQGACTDDDLRSYVITVHGIKSALANIGEWECSDLAAALEQAGRERNIAVMSARTPALLTALRNLIEKNTPVEEESAETLTDTDRAYLQDRLRTLKAACLVYDKKAAKDVLAEIQRKAWPHPMQDVLETIAEHLLHSKFKGIVSVVDTMI